MSTLRALRQLCGDYGSVWPGQVFNTDEATADALLGMGFVERCRTAEPITTAGLLAKMFAPAENKAIQPEANKANGWEFIPTYGGNGGQRSDSAPVVRGRKGKRT